MAELMTREREDSLPRVQLMLQKLGEKRERDKAREVQLMASMERPMAKIIYDSALEIGLFSLFVLFLVVGSILAPSGIGILTIVASFALLGLFFYRIFEGHLIRAGVITSYLLGGVLMYFVDQVMYRLRHLPWFKGLYGQVEIKMEYAAMRKFYTLRGVYETDETPLLPRRLCMAFQNLGPTFIKLGQIVSMLVALPRSFIAEFARLCDYLPAEDIESVKALIEKELKVPCVDELFKWVDSEPIGAASLAQVHCAVTKDGRDCVIKVQRPNLKAQFVRDYAIISPIASFLDIVFKIVGLVMPTLRQLNLGEVIRDYARVTSVDEIDFAFEGTIMQMYRNALERHGLTGDLHTPSVFWEYTTGEILTMERMWIQFKLVDIDPSQPLKVWPTLDFMRGMGYNPNLVLKRGHRAWWYPYARYGVLDQDVHHGNFLYCYDDTLTLVDFGINSYSGSSQYTEIQRPLTVQFWGGVMKADPVEIVKFKDLLPPSRTKVRHGKGISEAEALQIVGEELVTMLDPIIHVTDREGSTGGFITDVNEFVKSGEFFTLVGRMLTTLARRLELELPWNVWSLLRMIPYWATWMLLIDPMWNLFTEGDSLNGYWFGDNDGTVPYKGTNIYPSPKLPYEHEILYLPRPDEVIREEDYGLCHALPHTM